MKKKKYELWRKGKRVGSFANYICVLNAFYRKIAKMKPCQSIYVKDINEDKIIIDETHFWPINPKTGEPKTVVLVNK